VRRAARAAALVCAAVAAAPGAARANPFDLFGVSPRSRALGGALTAAPRDAEAAYFNPAAGAFSRDVALSLDYDLALPVLRIDGAPLDVYAPHGLGVGLSIPRTLTPKLGLTISSALHLPGVGVARILFTPATEPRFTMIDNRANRLTVYVGAGLRWGEHVALGGGVHFLAAAGNTTTFAIGGSAEDSNVPVAVLDARLPVRAAPIASVLVKPDDRFAVGLVWRAAVALDLDIHIPVGVELQSIASGMVDIVMAAIDYYTPGQVALGGSYRARSGDFTVVADVTWVRWSRLDRLFADLSVAIDLDTTPPLVDFTVPSPALHDVVEARAGAEWSGRFGATESRWALRAGYGFLPTPVPPQRGLSSVADATRHAVTVGGGVDLAELYPLLDRPLSIDLALGAQLLQPRLTVKDDPAAPFRSYRQGGVFWNATLGVTVRF